MGSWVLRCTVRYVPTWAVGWVCTIAAFTYADSTSHFSWNALADNLSYSVSFLLGVGGFALVVLVLLALCKRYGTTAGFRTMAAGFLVVPLLPLASAAGSPIGIAVLTHLAFATLIMPRPVLREV